MSFLILSILFKNLCQRSPTTPPSENFKFRPRIKKIIHWEKEVEAEVKIGLGQGRVEEGGNPKHNIYTAMTNFSRLALPTVVMLVHTFFVVGAVSSVLSAALAISLARVLPTAFPDHVDRVTVPNLPDDVSTAGATFRESRGSLDNPFSSVLVVFSLSGKRRSGLWGGFEKQSGEDFFMVKVRL